MDDLLFSKIEGYRSAMVQAGQMLSKGIIAEAEYVKIDTIMAQRYGISSCSIFRDIDLMGGGVRGNMSHYEEVTRCQGLSKE